MIISLANTAPCHTFGLVVCAFVRIALAIRRGYHPVLGAHIMLVLEHLVLLISSGLRLAPLALFVVLPWKANLAPARAIVAVSLPKSLVLFTMAYLRTQRLKVLQRFRQHNSVNLKMLSKTFCYCQEASGFK